MVMEITKKSDKRVSEKGIYDERNKLNDLTGKEWLYFLNSVETTNYPVSGKEAYGHKLRKQHPSPKPPQLMAKFINFFTKANEWVLDPFAGVGGTLIGASLAGRNSVGVELCESYIDIYKKVCAEEGFKEQILLNGDSKNIGTFKDVNQRQFDLILTDPPYGDMLSRTQNGEKRKRTGENTPTPFTALENDLGNMEADNYLETLKTIISESAIYLKDKKYLAVFVKDSQPKKGSLNMLHYDIAKKITEIPGIEYKGLKIWHDRNINLYPFGYPYAFTVNQLHQYILIFRKVL